MPTPPKPHLVLLEENKSHRTKAELEQRKKAEEALASGTSMKERPEVKSNPIAHKEFVRINKLLQKINKNDALNELIINRYCLINAECFDLQIKREHIYEVITSLDEKFNDEIENTLDDDKAKLIRDYLKSYNDSMKMLLSCDSMIQTKRKMLFDIEKENIFTIASALRSIPKKPEKKEQSGMAAMLAKRQASS